MLFALEFEETDVFTGVLAVVVLAGGPFAEVNDAVNCCVITLPEDEVGAGAAAEFTVATFEADELLAATFAAT